MGSGRVSYILGDIQANIEFEKSTIETSVTVSMSKKIEQAVIFDQNSNSLLVYGN